MPPIDQPDQPDSADDESRGESAPASGPSGANRSLARGRCHLRAGPCVHPEALHRLACDAIVCVIVHGPDGTPVDQGRAKRLVDGKLRRVLEERDSGQCRFIGCDTKRHLHAHHIKPWSRGGRADLANLILLCGFRLLREHGYQIEVVSPNMFRCRRPDGSTIEDGPPTRRDPWLDQLTAPLHAPPRITPSTTTPGWHGERLDLPLHRLPALSARPIDDRSLTTTRPYAAGAPASDAVDTTTGWPRARWSLGPRACTINVRWCNHNSPRPSQGS